jgi:hypothetical protein
LTLSAIASHPVNLHLLLADGSRNPAITYAIRPLVHVMTHPPTLRPASQIM